MRAHEKRHLAVQAARRTIQVSVLLFLVGLVYLSLYSHYFAAHALDDLASMPGADGAVLRAVDRGLAAVSDPEGFLRGFKGTLWSMRVAGVDVSDPLAAVELVAASKTFHGPMLLSILLPVGLALLLGRVFCSWVCPGYLLFEAAGKLRGLLRLAEIRPGQVRFSKRNKYVFLGVGLFAAAAFSRPLFALIYPPAVISRLVHAWVFGASLAGMLVILGVVVAVEVLVSPRWFCRSLCPGGALQGLLGAARLLRVRLVPDRCTRCGLCAPVCEEGLDPLAESDGIECDNCGQCVRHCPEVALRYGIGTRRREWLRPTGRAVAVFVACLLGALLLLHGSDGWAHHILGLPHYSYKENYPQVPTLEYPATTGPYDVLLTSYPGKPQPGEPANLSIYIKDRTSGEPYGQPITVRILQTFTFGRNRIAHPATRIEPFDQVHKLTATLDQPGEYIVELAVDVEGQEEIIPFLVVAGDPTSGWVVLATVIGGLGLFFVVIRAVKIKLKRRGRNNPSRAGAPTPSGAGS